MSRYYKLSGRASDESTYSSLDAIKICFIENYNLSASSKQSTNVVLDISAGLFVISTPNISSHVKEGKYQVTRPRAVAKVICL